MPLKAFGREKHLKLSTFSYWLAKYRRERRAADRNASEPQFQELTIPGQTASQPSLRLMRITYPDGTLVELPLL